MATKKCWAKRDFQDLADSWLIVAVGNLIAEVHASTRKLVRMCKGGSCQAAPA
jgi:hypothetical protein